MKPTFYNNKKGNLLFVIFNSTKINYCMFSFNAVIVYIFILEIYFCFLFLFLEGVMFIIVTLLGLHHRVASAVPITVKTESSGTRLQSDDIGNDSQGDKDNQLSTCGFVDGQPNLVNMSLSLATTTIAQQAAVVRREIASVLKKVNQLSH